MKKERSEKQKKVLQKGRALFLLSGIVSNVGSLEGRIQRLNKTAPISAKEAGLRLNEARKQLKEVQQILTDLPYEDFDDGEFGPNG